MGLDITSMANALPSTDEEAYHVYTPEGCTDRLDGRSPGQYESAYSKGFRAGSYSGYNEWRAELCRRFLGVEPRAVWDDPKKYAGRPFVELINYSDCEGAFGPQTCAKLAKDFKEHAARVLPSTEDGGWFSQKYADWQDAFERGANDGFVILH